MNNRTAKELRRIFDYTKPLNHEGYHQKFSGQRIKEVYTIKEDEESGQKVVVRQEPVNMVTYYCKDESRRFYKTIKKLYKKSKSKTDREIKDMLKDLYKSEGL